MAMATSARTTYVSIQEIHRKHLEVLGLWRSMQYTSFSYRAKTWKSMFKKTIKDILDRPRDEAFWRKVDDKIADINSLVFPEEIINDTSLYEFNCHGELCLRYITAINNAKDELRKAIDAFNEINTDDQITNTSDIERMMNQYISTEENTVVILILCHGAYVVNEDLTIDKIPAPENKLVEIVKRAPYGFQALTDFNYSSRYPKDKRSTRYSEEDIKQKLEEPYKLVLNNITSVSNPEQYLSRHYTSELMYETPEQSQQKFGFFNETCIHVGFEYSHIPFLKKQYSLDPPPSLGGFQRGEFAHGIVFIFTDLEGNQIQRNINRLQDFKSLINSGYIKPSSKVMAELLKNLGNNEVDFTPEQIKSKKYNLTDPDNLTTKIETQCLLDIIKSFHKKYTMFKIVDDSCGQFFKRVSDKETKKDKETKLTDEEREILLELYGKDMRCGRPSGVKGGFKKTRKRKHIKKQKKKKPRM
jgi:hypothetical protein